MKKLMIALAAVATAFGLYAADSGFISGAAFDSFDADGTAPDNITWTSPSGLKAAYWGDQVGEKAKLNTDTEKQCDLAETSRPARFLKTDEPLREKDGFLEINSGTELVSQRIKPTGTQTIGDNGLYFDGLVQFTSYEDEAPAIADNAKIALFPMVDDPEAETPTSSLWISASGNSSNLWKTAKKIDDGWHRVTIKMINNIKATGDAQVGFVVYVDGVAVECDAAKEAFDAAELTAEAKYFYNQAQLFGSLIKDTAEMTEVAFGGKGAIDEIAFTETAPSFAGSPKFAWITGAENIASFKYSTETWNKGDDALIVQLPMGETTGTAAVTDIEADEGFFVTNTTESVTVTAGATNYVGGAKSLGATVQIEGQADQYYENAAAALEALNVAGEITATLVLNAETSDAITIDNADLTLTLDLAGKEIVQGEADAAINVNYGALTVIDSKGDGVVSANVELEAESQAAVLAWGGTLAITDGKYDGLVNGSEIVISGGKFLASANDKDTLKAFVKDPDAELVEKEGYFVLEKITDFTVTVPEAEDNTTLAVTIDNVAAGDTNGVYTVAKDSTLKAVYTADEGYELDGEGEFTITYATKDTEITAPTAKQITVDFTVDEVANATLLAVSNGTEEVIADQGKYTVPTNATVVLYYAPAAGYRLAQTTAEVQITTADQVVDVKDEIVPAQIVYVAQIGDDPTKKYESLKVAIESAKAGETITVLCDCTNTETAVFYNTGTNAADQITLVNNYTVTLNTLEGNQYSIYIVNANVKMTGTGTFYKPAGPKANVGTASAIVVGSMKNPGQNGRPEKLGYGILDFEGNLVGGEEKAPSAYLPSAMIKVEAGYCNFVGGSVINWRNDVSGTTYKGRCVTASGIEYKDEAGNVTNKFVGTVTIQKGTFQSNEPLFKEACGDLKIVGKNNTAKLKPLVDRDLDYKDFCDDGYTFLKVTDEQDPDYGWWKVGINTFDITVTDGESAGTADPATFTVESQFPLQVALTKPAAPEGKLFASWSVTAGEITGDTLTIGAFTNGDVIATVNYTNKQVTATFVDGDTETKVVGDYGFTPEAPEAKGKEGYTFEKWDPAVAAITADTTFKAVYTPVTYTITYTTGNGAVVTNGVTEYTIETETFNLPVAADIDMSKVEGVTFDGWTNATSEAVVTEVQKGTKGNLEFFAKWAAVAPAGKDPTEDKPEDIDPTEKASERYGNKVPTTLANVSAKSIATWAQGAGNLVKGAEILENAFLLNCENTEAAINAAKENFKATSITINSDGTVTVGEPTGTYNGTIETWGKSELDTGEWTKDLDGAKFFELKLVPTNLE